MSGFGLSDSNAGRLGDAIKHNTVVRDVQLDLGGITQAADTANLRWWLTHSPSLQTLKLAGSDRTVINDAFLAAAGKNDTKLTQFTCQAMTFTAKAFCEFVSDTTVIQECSIRNCLVEGVNADEVEAAFAANKSFVSLRVLGRLSNIFLPALLRGLKNHPTLQHLQLSTVSMTTESCRAIQNLLESSDSLQHFEIDTQCDWDCQDETVSLDMIATGLRHSKSLTKLTVVPNCYDPASDRKRKATVTKKGKKRPL